MIYRKIAVFLLFALLPAVPALGGSATNEIDFDPLGNLNHYYLASSPSSEITPETQSLELKFLKSSYPKTLPTEPLILYNFDQEINSFDIQDYCLAFDLPEKEVYFARLSDGNNLSPELQLISKSGENPALACHGNLLLIAWEENQEIHCVFSEDKGQTFYDPEIIQITNEALASPSLTVDDLSNFHLAFVAANPDTNLRRIMHARIAKNTYPELKVVSESYDNIINLRIKHLGYQGFSGGSSLPRLLIFWQKEYSDRRESYFSLSFNMGQEFGSERFFKFEHELLDLFILDQKLYAATGNEPIVQEIEKQPPFTPQLYHPAEGAILNSPNIGLSLTMFGSSPLICKIDISNEESFPIDNTLSFEHLVSSLTQEVIEYDQPTALTDGSYFLRAYTFDGINTSPLSQTLKFKIDSLAPQILNLKTDRDKKNVIITGEISESPFWLSINGETVSPESADFRSQFELQPGKNCFTFVLSDEAGNTSIVTKEVAYNPDCPEITVLKPEAKDWFKPDSTIFIEAKVYDVQGDIEDGAEAAILIENDILEETLIYDQQESVLFGFVTLPSEMGDGEYSGAVLLADKLGNEGKETFTINIDGSPPTINAFMIQDNAYPDKLCFSNSQTSFNLPIADLGVGVDPFGSLVNISGVSFEGTVTPEGENISFICNSLLLEGTYEVEVIPRDLLGNIAEPSLICLVVDTTPPELTLSGSYESQTNKPIIKVQGKISEIYSPFMGYEPIKSFLVNIYNNQKKIESFGISENYFSKEIKLFPGENQILVEALDLAGNKAFADIKVFASISSSSSLINNLAYAPNPFSPSQDLPGSYSAYGKGMVFTYSLLQPADIKILILNITGTLIWTKDIKGSSSGVAAWNGIDQFGRRVGNGVYPFIFTASRDGTTDIRRGKIIVY